MLPIVYSSQEAKFNLVRIAVVHLLVIETAFEFVIYTVNEIGHDNVKT